MGESVEKLQVKIGGMQCSFCVESIHKAYARMDGVREVAVSLSHEEALIQYNPEKVTPTQLTDTLTSLGYTVRNPRKVLSYEDEQAEIRHLPRGACDILFGSLGGGQPSHLDSLPARGRAIQKFPAGVCPGQRKEPLNPVRFALYVRTFPGLGRAPGGPARR